MYAVVQKPIRPDCTHSDTLAPSEKLVSEGLVTKEQLNAAELTRSTLGGGLGRILVKKGLIGEKELEEFFSWGLGLEKVDLEGQTIDRTLLRFVPYPLAKKYNIIPILLTDDLLSIAISDPFEISSLEAELCCEGHPLSFVFVPSPQIEKAIKENYSVQKINRARDVEIVTKTKKQETPLEIDKIKELATSIGALETVNSILEGAYQDTASDIHIEPQENFIRVRFRIDGVLEERHLLPKKLLLPLVSRTKVLSGMNIAERRSPQDGRFTVKIHGEVLDCRTSAYPTVHGEKIVIRLLTKRSLIKLEQIGMSIQDRETFKKGVMKPHGMILVTGPTGSGKSTTLYSSLQLLNSINRNIVSIEDPIENEIPGINQSQLNTKANMTYASALRSMLRQDPDVIMIGEIRDSETADMAIRAALTGHLILSTLHTNTAIGAVTRLINLGVPHFLLASSLVGVLGQRLVRRICDECRHEVSWELGKGKLLGMKPSSPLFRGRGCKTCRFTGYVGRIGLFEIIPVEKPLRKLIEQNQKEEILIEEVEKRGWRSMLEDGKEKIRNGLTTVEEVLRVTEIE